MAASSAVAALDYIVVDTTVTAQVMSAYILVDHSRDLSLNRTHVAGLCRLATSCSGSTG